MSSLKVEEPVLRLDNARWKVEHHKGKNANDKKQVEVNVENPKQTVYVFKCTDTLVTVFGKVNSITLDNCVRTDVKFDDVIASVEVVNSKKLGVQANGSVPNIAIDKTEGVTLYILSEAGRKAEIVTSASVDINVITPGKTENDDPKEQPIPHQFVTVFNGDKLVTKPVEHVGV